MEKRSISKKEYQLFERELEYLTRSGVISSVQKNDITSLYQIQKKQSFTQILLYIGSILIGIGILSFIASNWQEIGKLSKFIFIIGLFISCTIAGYKLEGNYPKTSRSLHYLSVFVYGAGIFLVGQMFHFGGDFQHAFLLWSLGIIPLAWVLRDKWLVSLASLFVLIYMSNESFFSGASIPIWTILLILSAYYLNKQWGYSRIIGLFVLLMGLGFFGTSLNFVIKGNDALLYVIILAYFIIGLWLVYAATTEGCPLPLKNVYATTGHVVHGIAALSLTMPEIWPIEWLYIPFTLLYLCFVLFLIKKGNLINIVILCVFIFRFYLDITFDFLPKSLVFIVGGFILLGFGFYFEKQRKKGGITID